MRYRVRGKLATGQPVIVKPDVANAFEAATQAGRLLAQAGHDLATIKEVSIKPMKDSKQSSVYVGKVPTPGKRRRPGGDKATATPVATPAPSAAATPAKPAAQPAAKSAKK